MSIRDFFKSSMQSEPDHDSLRYFQTLDGSSTSFMIADVDRNIIYTNESVLKLLKDSEAELKKALPQFSADNLIGQNIDIFHKNPAHQRGILSNLREKMVSSITVGELNFQLTLIPLRDSNNQPIGTSVEWLDQSELILKAGMLDALDRSQAVIEFKPDGTIIKANENFLNAMGYSSEEVVNRHHSMFVEDHVKNSPEYKQLWQTLNRGEFVSDVFKRIGKHGKEVWIQASYNPILDSAGQVKSVVKYAVDVTEERLKNADYEGQINAISKSQAVIEFNMDGTIRTANDNFLQTMGYSMDEVRGKHHGIFVDPEYRNSQEYKDFWQQLNDGVYASEEFKRFAKGGKVVWIQASYNPILDLNGKPFKVVKYATDITSRKTAINEIKRVLTELSEGDLTTSVTQSFEGEFKEISDALTRFIDDLARMISEIKSASVTINSAASEIAQGNADLSSRTEEQASSLEETAASMEEITGTVRLNSENADQANGLASQASTIAEDGGSLIEKVVVTMGSINESAQKISDIIGVIDGIAFQTNILALNAAVEAARAGEQGRGFAVVASEVRSLAQRSAEAAKDIKALISDSVSKIEDGNSLVTKSGETMNEVVTSIKRVNDIMAEIAAASAEQATGIDEVSKAVSQMDEVTQQNAALVEEAAAAAESLQAQSDNMNQQISVFRLDDNDQPMPAQRSQGMVSGAAARESRPAKPKQTIRSIPPKSSSSDEDEWESF